MAEENDFVTAHSRMSLSSEGEDMKYAWSTGSKQKNNKRKEEDAGMSVYGRIVLRKQMEYEWWQLFLGANLYQYLYMVYFKLSMLTIWLL